MTISNELLTVEIAGHGAEIVSLKKQGRECLWTGDPAFWNRHAPILFPAVGKPFNNELHVGDSVYAMKQHGYARDTEFQVVADNLQMKPSDSVKLRALFPSNTNYPYRLDLDVCYQLVADSVEATWTVTNSDTCEAFFQIGAHPGFLLPDYKADNPIHGFIRFYNSLGRHVAPVIVSALTDGNRIPLGKTRHIPAEMPITADTFAHDALVFEDGQVTAAELLDKGRRPVLRVVCSQAQAFGIWAPFKAGCPFVCLEPWCGICDPQGFTSDISLRQYIHRLLPGGQYTFSYTIKILD